MRPENDPTEFGRRAFLRGGSLWLAARSAGAQAAPGVTFGLMTDLHYADKPAAGTRYYRETAAKMREALDAFRQAGAAFAVELGDFIDEAPAAETEAGYLTAIEDEYRRFRGDRYHVLGNHCVWTLSKEEFLRACGFERTYDSFERGGIHFVLLDACFRGDGTPYGRRNFDWKDAEVPPRERRWLAADLAAARNPAIIFVHQRLDVGPPYGIASAPEVRRILEESRRVLAVFQGHDHRGAYAEISGIPYITLRAMVEGSGKESNAYCVVRASAGGGLEMRGYRRQPSYGRNAAETR